MDVMDKKTLGEEINWHGQLEEFYQKASRNPQHINYSNGGYMYNWHKTERLKLERLYRTRFPYPHL